MKNRRSCSVCARAGRALFFPLYVERIGLFMNLEIKDQTFPGTVIQRNHMRGIDGEEFLDKIFFISDGIMLSQIKDISGIDGTTLQNWVKRGWIGNTVNKKYSKNQLARILIVNMLRGSLHLETIDALLKYVNGTINCEEDDIIPEATLYGFICRIADQASEKGAMTPSELEATVKSVVASYPEKIPGARVRLEKAMCIILTAYYAALVRDTANDLLKDINLL